MKLEVAINYMNHLLSLTFLNKQLLLTIKMKMAIQEHHSSDKLHTK